MYASEQKRTQVKSLKIYQQTTVYIKTCSALVDYNYSIDV